MTANKMTLFNALHHQTKPFILNNIWDAASAKILEQQGASAVATSSASLAWSLGYADGYQLPFGLLLESIERIERTISIPLSVDIENGYSDQPGEVADRVSELQALGVAGINIEDGSGDPELLCQKISAIKEKCPPVFVNARTDVYLANLVEPALQASVTLRRLKRYAESGCDGLFIPGLTDTDQATNWQQNLTLPVNLMAGDDVQLAAFKGAGIRRISSGPTSFIRAYSTLLNSSAPNTLDYNQLNDMFSRPISETVSNAGSKS